MSDTVDSVTIVGGGDSGLLAALCIKQWNQRIDVTVVDDFSQDIPQVGKSTFWNICEVLHRHLNIPETRFLQEVKPVWKCSVYFEDWCGYEPFHFPFDGTSKFPDMHTYDIGERFYYHYDELYKSPDHLSKNEEIVEQGVSPWYFDPNSFTHEKYDVVAYHLNTKRFNSFLRDLCRERGISLVNDEITGVNTDGNRVRRVLSKSQNYVSDLYVDATGFDRVIKQELDSEFRDFGFPLDSAFNTRVDLDLGDAVSATVVRSGEYGWFWQIDTYDNRDLGYVYGSDYVSKADARAEFVDFCNGDVTTGDETVAADDVVHFEFSSGYYYPAWEENCLAIGNAGGFVEPLQSTGLTVNALAATVLGYMLSARGRVMGDGIRDRYNSWVRRHWESIHDFITVHYKLGSGDSAFWQDVEEMDVSPRVEHLFEEFDRNGYDTNGIDPTATDPDIEDLDIFTPDNFYEIMRNMGATSAFYEDNDFDVSEEIKRERDEYYQDIREDVNGYLTTKELYHNLFDQGVIPE